MKCEAFQFKKTKASWIEISCFSRMPQLFTKDIALVQQFFEALCKVGADGALGNHYCCLLILLSS